MAAAHGVPLGGCRTNVEAALDLLVRATLCDASLFHSPRVQRSNYPSSLPPLVPLFGRAPSPLGYCSRKRRSHSRRCRQSNRNVESALGPTRSPISPALHHAHRGNALEREVRWLRCEVEARATLSLSIAPGRFHRAPVSLNRARMQGSRAMVLIDFGRQLAPSRFCRVLGRLTNL